MVAFLPLALGAAGMLSAYAKNRQYRPVLEANDKTGALLDIAGAGLGGYIGGQAFEQQPQQPVGLEGILGGLGQSGFGAQLPMNLPQQQAGPPRFIPAEQLGIAPGETAGVPDQLGGNALEELARLSQAGVNRQTNPFLGLFGG